MSHKLKNYKHENLTSTQITDILIHTSFYWFRIVCGIVIYMISFEYDFKNLLETVETNNFIFMEVFNFFLFFIIINSVVTGNIFGYYVSIIIMLHNTVLTIFIPASPDPSNLVSKGEWIITSINSFLFVLEAIISLFLLYSRRNIFSYSLFKKVSLNEKVNNAFAIRKCLQTLGVVNVFLALSMTIKFITPITMNFGMITSLSLGYMLLTIIQQLFISIKFEDEIVWMRKTSIVLSIIKISLPILMIIYMNKTLDESTDIFESLFLYFIFADQIIITLAIIYYLSIDLGNFGSGLKNNSKIKTINMSL